MVVVDRLEKSFGNNKVLKEVSISLKPGDIYALIGPNGSGKTTLVKIMVGLLDADRGLVKFFDADIKKNALTAKQMLSYISDGPLGYNFLTGEEFLIFAASLRGVNKVEAMEKIDELRDVFPIGEVLRQPMDHYSRGNLQKVAFLAALLGEPKVMIIDEPVVGLDPDSAVRFGEKIVEFAAMGGIVLFVTHTLSFADKYANRYGVLKNGTLIAEGEMNNDLNLEKIYRDKIKD